MPRNLQHAIQSLLRSERRLVFCGSLLLIFGLAYSVMCAFDISTAVDPHSYWQLAHFEIPNSEHRRYRFVIPMLAAGINWFIVHIGHLVNRNSLNGPFPMKLSFFVVNLPIAAAWCTLIYEYCKAYGAGRIAAGIGLLAVATSYWTMENVGEPRVDMLFCLAVICTLLGVKTGSRALLWSAIIIGPFSKENFLFIAPILYFSTMPKWKITAGLLLTGALVFASRWYIDLLNHHAVSQSVSEDFNVIRSLPDNIARLRIPGYWNEMLATFGMWPLAPLSAVLCFGRLRGAKPVYSEGYILFFLLSALFQILINGEYARMMYMLMPVWAIVVSRAAQQWISWFRAQQIMR